MASVVLEILRMPLGVPELLHDGLAWPALLSRHCKMAQGSQPPEGTRQNVTVRRIARRTVVVMRRQLRVTLTLMLILTLTVTLTLILTLTPIVIRVVVRIMVPLWVP